MKFINVSIFFIILAFSFFDVSAEQTNRLPLYIVANDIDRKLNFDLFSNFKTIEVVWVSSPEGINENASKILFLGGPLSSGTGPSIMKIFGFRVGIQNKNNYMMIGGKDRYETQTLVLRYFNKILMFYFPIRHQETNYWCVPAAIQSILEYYGHNADQKYIADRFGRGQGGMMFGELTTALEAHGVKIERFDSNELLKRHLAEGHFVISIYKNSAYAPALHSVIALGAIGDKLFIADPSWLLTRKDGSLVVNWDLVYSMSFDDFLWYTNNLERAIAIHEVS